MVGGLIATVAVTRQPELFTATVLEDPIVDIIEYLSTNDDAFNKKVFGDINEKDIYEHIKSYSPYHVEINKKLSNLLILSSEDHPQAHHGRKLIARLRNEFNDQKNFNRIFFKQVTSSDPEIAKIALWQAFVINSAFKQDVLIRPNE